MSDGVEPLHLERPYKRQCLPRLQTHETLVKIYDVNDFSRDVNCCAPLTMNSRNGMATFADKNSPSIVYGNCLVQVEHNTANGN